MQIREFCKQTDTEFFIKAYNSEMKYAPFSVPLNADKLNNFVLRNVDKGKEFIFICNNEGYRGIIHFGLEPDNEKEGHVYLLLAEKSCTALMLLKEAENKLAQLGVRYIRCFPWTPNPYQFILYGAEAYCWAGLYPSNNAFHQLSYNIDLDIVVMSLRMNERPEYKGLSDSRLTVEEIPVREDGLVTSGQYIAYDSGVQVGRSGYYYLKAISDHLGKGYGQIDIWINEEYHGKNLGKQLMTLAHRQLFDLGARNVILATNQNFFRAIKFYEGFGYRAETIRAWCYSKEIGS